MDNEKQVIWIWSHARSIPPHQLRIHPWQFIMPFLLVLLIVSVFTFSLVSWLSLSGLGMSLPQFVGATLKILAWKISGGFAWSLKAPQLIEIITSHGTIATLIIALFSLACGTYAGWFISKPQLAPRDGYQHIRGPQRYKGKDAQRILRKQLRNEK